MLNENINLGVARTALLGLVVECPLGEGAETCALNAQRQLPFSVKFQWVQSLPAAELLKLYEGHRRCHDRSLGLQYKPLN